MIFKVAETCEPGNKVLPGKQAVSAWTAVGLEIVIKSERNGAALKAPNCWSYDCQVLMST